MSAARCYCHELSPGARRAGDECGFCERQARQERMSDKQYPTDPEGQKDAGSDRHTRFKPCTKSTWCVREEGHSGACDIRNRPLVK